MMVRDLPAWALQENSDPKLQQEISPSESVAGQSEAISPPLLPLMTIGEAATILHVSPRTIRRIVDRGELQVVRIGRSIRIRQEEIKRLILGTTNY